MSCSKYETAVMALVAPALWAKVRALSATERTTAWRLSLPRLLPHSPTPTTASRLYSWRPISASRSSFTFAHGVVSVAYTSKRELEVE